MGVETLKQFEVSAGSGQASLMISKGGARVGAGRKRIGETRKISLTLTKAKWIEIDCAVEMEDISQSEVIRRMLEQ